MTFTLSGNHRESALRPRWTCGTAILFHSPYYYIQQNDVIYVTPSDRKVNTRSEQLQIYPYLISGTSIAMVILAFCI